MRNEPLDLRALLHPAGAYAHPTDVLRDPDLTLYEKRAILASWASDACSVEAAPALRRLDQAAAAVQFDDVMDALQELDRLAADEPTALRGSRSAKDASGRGGEGHPHIV